MGDVGSAGGGGGAGGPGVRVAGVAQATALSAATGAGRGLAGQFVAAGIVVLVLALVGGVFAGNRMSRRLTESHDAFFSAWDHEQRTLGEYAARVRGLQQGLLGLTGEGSEASGPAGAPVVTGPARAQVEELARQLGALGQDLGSLQQVAGQRQSIVARSAEGLRREMTGALWAALIGLFAAAALSYIWLGRAAVTPLGGLRRALETADQAQQALVTALGPWFGRVAEHIALWSNEAQRQVVLSGQVAESSGQLSRAARAFSEKAEVLRALVTRLGPVAQQVRDFGDESKVLAISTAMEGARLDAQGRGFTVVAEEIRRMAAETRQVARDLQETERQVAAAADSADRSARHVADELEAVSRRAADLRRYCEGLQAGLGELQARLTSAGAAAAGAGRAALARSSWDLRAAVDRALGGAPGVSAQGTPGVAGSGGAGVEAARQVAARESTATGGAAAAPGTASGATADAGAAPAGAGGTAAPREVVGDGPAPLPGEADRPA